MSHRRSTIAAASAAAALVLSGTPAFGGDDWKKEFQRQFSSKNSWERWKAVKLLDPNDKDSLKVLLDVLKKEDWYIRGAAIEVLANAYDAKTVEEMRKLLKSAESTVQEGICVAFGKSKDIGRVEDLVESLKKGKDWKVKRAAANGLKNMPDKRGVGPLIESLEKEKGNFLLWIHVLEALEKITGQKNLNTPADWKTWWEANQKDWNPDEDAKKDDTQAKGEGPKTQVKGTDLEFKSRGKGRPLLVLPDYGYEKDYLETYMRNLEESSQIIYMALPAFHDFKEPKLENAPNLPAPWYPIDRLAETFEELRQVLIKEKKLKDQPFAVMAHGLSSWIAIRYAQKHPKGISRMVLCSPYSSQKAHRDGLNRMIAEGKKTGDIELEHEALTHLYDQQKGKSEYEPTGEEENRALHRKAFTIYFADWRDLEIARIFGPWIQKGRRDMPRVEREMGGCFIPDFNIVKEPEVATPSLVMVGTAALETSIEDCEQIVKRSSRGELMVFNKSSRMPFIEENSKFVSVMQKFLAK